jgi:tRNA dimethylallyltransferase
VSHEQLAENPIIPLAVLVLGPTGSGKTALSIQLAARFGGEIISCDSVAVYRGMDLGAAKPMRGIRDQIPHFLIDVANPDTSFTAGAYARQARAALAEIAARSRLPIISGGTGLYLRALTEGLFSGPERNPRLRDRLQRSHLRRSSGWLHRLLRRLDPDTAARIHWNDTPKLIRAIEVCLTARRPMSQLLDSKNKARDPLLGFRLLRIGLNPARAALYQRIDRRCAQMFAAGLVEETRMLLDRYSRVRALDSLGYKQALAVIDGALTPEEGVKAAAQGHRNYAKRQLTWFRREPEVHWLEGFGDDLTIARQAAQLVANALG